MKKEKVIYSVETTDKTIYIVENQLIIDKNLSESPFLDVKLGDKHSKYPIKKEFEIKEIGNNILEVSYISGKTELLYPSIIEKVVYKEVEVTEVEAKKC